MAIGEFRLTNSRYVRPGAYVGYVPIPRPTADPGDPRYPCYVGRGSRLALVSNLPTRRAYVENRQLNFSSTPPYIAPLVNPAINDQTRAFLYKQNREVVPTSKWAFRESDPGSGVYDQVEIQLTEFDRNATYLIDYQSSDRDDLYDEIGFVGLRNMLTVGDTEGQNKYIEYEDYRVITDVLGNVEGGDPDALIASDENSQTEGRNGAVVQTYPAAPLPADQALVSHDATSKYTHDYSMKYTIECVQVDSATTPQLEAWFEIKIEPLSGGNSQENKWPMHSNMEGTGDIVDNAPAGRTLVFSVTNPNDTPPGSGYTSTYVLDTKNYGYGDDIVLKFDWTGTGTDGIFTVGDTFTWESYGKGLIEFSSAHDNDNQFAEVTAPVEAGSYVTSGADNSSGGRIAIGSGTDYTGDYDRHYRMQVYSYDATPLDSGLLVSIGAGATLLTGDGALTNFTSVLDVGDWINVGGEVVQVIDITDDANATVRPAHVAGATSVTYNKGGPSGSGPGGDRTFSVAWSAWDEIPYSQGVISVDESDPTTYMNVELEHGIYVDFDLGPGHRAQDLTNEITETSPPTTLVQALALCADAQSVYDLHDQEDSTVHQAGSGGNHQTTLLAPTTEAELIAACGELQTLYTAHITDDDMHEPVDTVWMLDSNIEVVDLATAVTFLVDFKEKYNRHIKAVGFIEGDTWTFRALAPRQNYAAKDDRFYTMTVGTVGGTAGSEYITMSWYTDTYEGGFDNFTVPYNDIYVTMTDNIHLCFRNFPNSDDTLTPKEQYDTGDKFWFTTVNENLMDWSLRTRTSETIGEEDIFQDVLGRVTGIPLSWYIILSDTPENVRYVKKTSDGSLLSYTAVLDAGNPTPYIAFATKPDSDVLVSYDHRGQEPDPGNTYYISAERLRLDSEYDVPIRYLTRDDMARGLGPKTADNSLWIMGDIAFDTSFFGAYFCQVKDASGNQVFSTADYRRAIQATETVRAITDLCVVGFLAALPEAKASVERMADPFENSERMLWVGAQIGYPIGDEDTPDTLVYLARKTLQFSGNNPGRGHVVLIGNTEASRTLVLDDGTTTRVDLDGSYIAGYTAARNAAFRDPAETILRKDCTSFESMQTWGEKEELILGSSAITYLSDVGGGIYRYNESVTVDTSAPDLSEISAMNQKIYVTRKVSKDMDNALISIVPPSPAAGVAIVQAFLTDELATIVSSGVIAPYGSETNPPTVRQIDPGSDLYVFVDERDRRLYHFGYFFNIRYPIKRLFGLYSVDTRFWDNRQ